MGDSGLVAMTYKGYTLCPQPSISPSFDIRRSVPPLRQSPMMCFRGKRRVLRRFIRGIVKHSQNLIYIP